LDNFVLYVFLGFLAMAVAINLTAPQQIASRLSDIAEELKRANDLTEAAQKSAALRRKTDTPEP
jgi:hypothetical protein